MSAKLPDRVRAGDLITDEWANSIRDAIASGTLHAGLGSGIRLDRTAGGTAISTYQPLRFFGVASGNISARSGTTLGTGKVTRHYSDGGTDTSTTIDYDVLNPSSNTMGSGEGITSGKYCFVQEDSDGNLVVGTLEC